MNFLKKIFSQKKSPVFLTAVLAFVLVGIFLIAPPALASTFGWLGTVLGFIIYVLIIVPLGWLIVLAVEILIAFCQYNSFIDASAVTIGWTLVRDICNMGFVVVLLIIAFATILNIETYHYKKLLKDVIIMAILVNFSKLICGLVIDFSQVIMLTFVNAFKQIGGNNLLGGLNMSKLMTMSGRENEMGSGFWQTVGTYVLIAVIMFIALITVVVMVVVIAYRIVMLWVLVVLSPVAYLLSSFPAGKSYAGEWWSNFGKQVAIGPVLAFFLWLSFSILAGGSNNDLSKDLSKISAGSSEASAGLGREAAHGPASEATSTSNMLSFTVCISLLIASLMITQKVGGIAGAAAGKGLGIATKVGSWAAAAPWKAAGAGYNYAVERASAKLGVVLPLSKENLGKWKEGYQKMRERSKRRRTDEIAGKVIDRAKGGRLSRLSAYLGSPREAFEMASTPGRGIGSVLSKGGKGMGEELARVNQKRRLLSRVEQWKKSDNLSDIDVADTKNKVMQMYASGNHEEADALMEEVMTGKKREPGAQKEQAGALKGEARSNDQAKAIFEVELEDRGIDPRSEEGKDLVGKWADKRVKDKKETDWSAPDIAKEIETELEALSPKWKSGEMVSINEGGREKEGQIAEIVKDDDSKLAVKVKVQMEGEAEPREFDLSQRNAPGGYTMKNMDETHVKGIMDDINLKLKEDIAPRREAKAREIRAAQGGGPFELTRLQNERRAIIGEEKNLQKKLKKFKTALKAKNPEEEEEKEGKK